MKEFAFESWVGGEENGRDKLKPSSVVKLDKAGSRIDFEEWFNKDK
jgi:hypothetical protein